MSRFAYSELVTTQASTDETLEAVRSTLAVLGAGPRYEGSKVVGSLGSRAKTRLLGSNFGSRVWLPVKIAAQVNDDGASRSVEITVAEDFGFGILNYGSEGHMRARCQQVLIQVADGVRSRVAAALPMVAESPRSNVDARLATLERLRSTGAISADEYAARRTTILDEI